jgi:hypothetical protein
MRIMVGFATVIYAVAPARAQSGAAGACGIEVHENAISTCLPAMSADGSTIAVESVEPDGGRGAVNLTVLFLPVKGGKAESLVVVTADETGGSELDDSVRAKIEPRLHTLAQRIAGYKPLRALAVLHDRDAPATQTIDDGDLSVIVTTKAVSATRGKKTAKLALPGASTGKCRGANPPYVDGMWVSPDASTRWLVVSTAYRGNDSCSEPAPAWRVLALPPAAVAASSKAQVEQLIDAEMRALKGGKTADLEKLFAPGAGIVYSTRGDEKEGFVGVDGLEQGLSVGMGILEPPVVSDRTIVIAPDGTSAWVTMNVKVKAFAGDTGQQFFTYRASEIAQLFPAGWRIVGGMWSMPTPNKTLDDASRASQIVLGTLPSKVDEATIDEAFASMSGNGINAGDDAKLMFPRKDLVAIGSAKGEKTAGGAKFAKAWNHAWQGKVTIDGEHIAQATPNGTTGWLIANIRWEKTKGTKRWDVPLRVFLVFMRATKDAEWELAHAQFASSEPYGG